MSTDADKIAIEKAEAQPVDPPVKQKKKGVFWGCCTWYFCLAAICLIVLVVMLVVAFAIIPALAQKKVNNSYLELNGMEIKAPTADSFTLSIDSTLKGVKGPIKSTIKEFNADFLLDGGKSDKPFINVPIPEAKPRGDTPIIITDHDTTVTDYASFLEFASTLMSSTSLKVAIRGKTKVHVSAFRASVDYNEVVETKGLNGLAGMKIKSYSLKSGPNGQNLEGIVIIKNPSVVSLQAGTIEFDMKYEGATIGKGKLPDLFLKPGDLEYPFNAAANLTALLGILGTPHSDDEPLIMQIRGTKVSYDDKEVPWLTTLLSAHDIDCELA